MAGLYSENLTFDAPTVSVHPAARPSRASPFFQNRVSISTMASAIDLEVVGLGVARDEAAELGPPTAVEPGGGGDPGLVDPAGVGRVGVREQLHGDPEVLAVDAGGVRAGAAGGDRLDHAGSVDRELAAGEGVGAEQLGGLGSGHLERVGAGRQACGAVGRVEAGSAVEVHVLLGVIVVEVDRHARDVGREDGSRELASPWRDGRGHRRSEQERERYGCRERECFAPHGDPLRLLRWRDRTLRADARNPSPLGSPRAPHRLPSTFLWASLHVKDPK